MKIYVKAIHAFLVFAEPSNFWTRDEVTPITRLETFKVLFVLIEILHGLQIWRHRFDSA